MMGKGEENSSQRNDVKTGRPKSSNTLEEVALKPCQLFHAMSFAWNVFLPTFHNPVYFLQLSSDRIYSIGTSLTLSFSNFYSLCTFCFA